MVADLYSLLAPSFHPDQVVSSSWITKGKVTERKDCTTSGARLEEVLVYGCVVGMLITYFYSMALKPLNDAHIYVPSPLFESVGVPFQLYQVYICYVYFPWLTDLT